MDRRILFLGQKDLGEKCFKAILGEDNRDNFFVVGAVTNISCSQVWWGTNNIYKSCKELNLPVITNEERNIDMIADLILQEKVNTIVSVQHNWILPKEIIALVDGEAFNLHNAKIPDYKGYNPFNHAILNGEKYYSSTIHKMFEEVDMGNIVFEETFEIDEFETAVSLYNKAQIAALKVFNLLIEYLLGRKEPLNKTVEGNGKFYSRASLEKKRQILDSSDPSEVDRKARAFFFPPFEPAYIMLNSKKFYVLPHQFWENKDGR